MKTFIWARLENLTLEYHPEGGLVIVADDYQKAWNNYRDDGVYQDFHLNLIMFLMLSIMMLKKCLILIEILDAAKIS
jgi:hypothetical protein